MEPINLCGEQVAKEPSQTSLKETKQTAQILFLSLFRQKDRQWTRSWGVFKAALRVRKGKEGKVSAFKPAPTAPR